MIKIALVDDHAMFREGLNFTLSQEDDFEVMNESSNGKEFITFLEENQENKPDVVIMDINMPVMDGETATSLALSIYPDLSIITLSMFSDTDYYQKMVAVGVKGFLMKEAGVIELSEAIRAVVNGGTYFSQDLLQRIIMEISNPKVISSRQKAIDLTRREEEVLEQICKGLDNKEIGDRLFISQKTVEGHKTNLMSKTNTKNAINLMLFAIKHNLVNIDFLNE
jgi:DNA-binding NarL/FixJ family response regulator